MNDIDLEMADAKIKIPCVFSCYNKYIIFMVLKREGIGMKILRCISKLVLNAFLFLFLLLIAIIMNPLTVLLFLISIPIALVFTWILALFILHAFTDNPSTTAVTITSSILFIVFFIVDYIKDKLEI